MDVNSAWMRALARHSDTAALMAGHAWSETIVGPPDAWPESLRVAVTICLSSDFPILVTWGPDLSMIYNEGYRTILGRDKHPGAIGRPVREVWSEVWTELEPLFAQVQTSGLAYNAKHLPLQINRNGYLEEVFFTFCYSPIHLGSEVAGVLDIAMETTVEVVADRRLSLLGSLATAMVDAPDVTAVCTAAVAAIGGTADATAAEIRLWVGDQLVPLATSESASRRLIEDHHFAGIRSSAPVVLDEDWVEGTPAACVALAVGSGECAGVLAVRLNPSRPFDGAHRTFVELVGRAVSASLENAYRRSVELGRQRHISDTLQAAMIEPASDLPTVAARYRPAAGHLSVGGDWYDVISLPDGRRALVVGDCVGHGLDAATAMGQLRSAARALLLEGRSPAEVIEAMDLFAASVPGGDCATMACAVIDLEAGTATHARAGHPPPLLLRRAGATWLEHESSTPLAVPRGKRTEAVTPVTPGDLIVLYSDGLYERRGELPRAGLDRLRDSVTNHAEEPVQSIADAVIAEMLEPRPDDDVVLLIKRVH